MPDKPDYDALVSQRRRGRWVDLFNTMQPGDVKVVSLHQGETPKQAQQSLLGSIARTPHRGLFATRIREGVLYAIYLKEEDRRA